MINTKKMERSQSNSKRSDQQKSQDVAHRPVSSSNQKPTTGKPQNLEKKRIFDPTSYCGICEERISDLCGTNCKFRGENSQDPCTVKVGECSHAFHTHCIHSWLKTFKMCINCKKDWIHKITVKRR